MFVSSDVSGCEYLLISGPARESRLSIRGGTINDHVRTTRCLSPTYRILFALNAPPPAQSTVTHTRPVRRP